jgi:hypothetical protein
MPIDEEHTSDKGPETYLAEQGQLLEMHVPRHAPAHGDLPAEVLKAGGHILYALPAVEVKLVPAGATLRGLEPHALPGPAVPDRFGLCVWVCVGENESTTRRGPAGKLGGHSLSARTCEASAGAASSSPCCCCSCSSCSWCARAAVVPSPVAAAPPAAAASACLGVCAAYEQGCVSGVCVGGYRRTQSRTHLL